MGNLFIIWTTFICLNGEIRESKFVSPNMYSSDIYESIKEVNLNKERWREIFGNFPCIPFMIQHEEVSEKLLLKSILNLSGV